MWLQHLSMTWLIWSLLVKQAAGVHCILSCNWLFMAGHSFFLTTGYVSEPPTRGFLCVRTCDALNLFLEWGNPLKKWPHFKQKIGHHLSYIDYLYKGLHHIDIKVYMLMNYDRIKPKWWLNHSFWSLLIWPHPARFKICLVTWPHCSVIVTWHCHCGCLDTKWLSKDKQFKCTFQQSKLLVKNVRYMAIWSRNSSPWRYEFSKSQDKNKSHLFGILFNQNPLRNPSSFGLLVISEGVLVEQNTSLGGFYYLNAPEFFHFGTMGEITQYPGNHNDHVMWPMILWQHNGLMWPNKF